MLFHFIRIIWLPVLLIFLFLYNAPYDIDGLFFNYFTPAQQKFCKLNWWTNLFAVNNIVKVDQMCLPHTWFIAAHLQLTIIGSILLYVMLKNKKKGFLLAALGLAFSSIAIYTSAFRHNYNGLYWSAYGNLKETAAFPEELTMVYINTIPRVGPYLLGFCAACLTHTLQRMKYIFSTKMALFILLSSSIVAITYTRSGLESLFNPAKPYTRTENATYATLNRTLFAIPVACLLIIHRTTGFGSLTKLLEREIYVPLGRLQYCAFLVGYPLHLFLNLTERTNVHATGRLILSWWITADIVWIYAISFAAHLTLEAPINNLIKLLTRVIFRSTRKQEKSNLDKKTE